jgi:hypothetical protein
MHIPDPIELMNNRIDELASQYIEGECMACHKEVNYELICPSPTGDGPAVCYECLGPDLQEKYDNFFTPVSQ